MTLKKLETEYKKAIAKPKEALKEYIGRDAVIPMGKFKGRLGVIGGLFFDDDGNILATIRPYRLAGGPREDLLWDHLDARTFWRISDEDLKKEYCDDCKHLSPSEAEQDVHKHPKPHHKCKAYPDRNGGTLYHLGEHPRLPRPFGCKCYETKE